MDLPLVTFEVIPCIELSYMLLDRLFVVLKNGSVVGQNTPNSKSLTYQFSITDVNCRNKNTDIFNVIVSDNRRFFVYNRSNVDWVYDNQLKTCTKLDKLCSVELDYYCYERAFYTNEMLLFGSGIRLTLINLLTGQLVYIQTSHVICYFTIELGKYILIQSYGNDILLDYYSFVQLKQYENPEIEEACIAREHILYNVKNYGTEKATFKILSTTNDNAKLESMINKVIRVEYGWGCISYVDGYIYYKLVDKLFAVSKDLDNPVLIHTTDMYSKYIINGYYIIVVCGQKITLYKTMKRSRDLGYWLLLHDRCKNCLFERKVLTIIASYIY